MVKDTKTKNVKAKSKSNTKTKSITTKDNEISVIGKVVGLYRNYD